MLDARIDLTVGGFRLDVELTAAAGEVVAVLGPNGAGKTTLLRALAGLVEGGRLTLDGVVLDRLPPEKRPIGVVFQDYLLFPHLSVRDNVAFGATRHAADQWLARVGLADRGGARPAELSGGQAQRVALARALATDPTLLLLDEPLAALDVRTRSEIRRDLRHHLSDFPGVTLLVTHDPVDAFALADRIVVLEGGRVTQSGPPADVAARPRSDYVAELVGTNLVRGVAHQGVVSTSGGTLVAATTVEGPVLAVVPPGAVALHRTHPEGSPRNVWEGRIAALDRLVDRVHVRVEGPIPLVAAVVPAAVEDLALRVDDSIWVAVKATEIEVYPV
ncbi:MAG: transporter ATP-binding protein [Acidimicrobiales bacterium]|nr:transporter ATP-binding protein [Acidimicrobiales bacterium]